MVEFKSPQVPKRRDYRRRVTEDCMNPRANGESSEGLPQATRKKSGPPVPAVSTKTAGGCATVSPSAEPTWLHNKTVHSVPTLGKRKMWPTGKSSRMKTTRHSEEDEASKPPKRKGVERGINEDPVHRQRPAWRASTWDSTNCAEKKRTNQVGSGRLQVASGAKMARP